MTFKPPLPNVTLTKSILFFLIGSCLLIILCGPVFAEAEMFKAFTDEAPFYEIKGNGLEPITKIAVDNNTFRKRTMRNFWDSNYYGEIRSVKYGVSLPGEYPYQLYVRWLTYKEDIDLDLWILRIDNNTGDIYYYNSNGDWVTTITVFDNHTSQTTLDREVTIKIPWNMASNTFFIGMDDVLNGVLDGTILYVEQEGAIGSYWDSDYYGQVRTALVANLTLPGDYPYQLYGQWLSDQKRPLELWIIRIDNDTGTIYYYNSNGDWVTTTTAFDSHNSYNTLDRNVTIDIPWHISSNKFYVGMDDTPNGIIDGTIIFAEAVED